MRLSVFTTVTEPKKRGDNFRDALDCYADLADELVVVDGTNSMSHNSGFSHDNYKVVVSHWPNEFEWDFIGKQFQKGYETATGDWVIHADLDFIFHEKDMPLIRKVLEENSDAPALSFWKFQFIQPDRFNLKSRLVLAVNKKKYGDRIKFDSGGDLCQPSLDGKEIKVDDVPEARIAFYNYEKLTKNKEQIIDDITRMERAYHRTFDHTLYSTDLSDKSTYEGWLRMAHGRYNKPHNFIPLSEHPKYVQKTIKNLTPDQWGYSGFGELGVNSYV